MSFRDVVVLRGPPPPPTSRLKPHWPRVIVTPPSSETFRKKRASYVLHGKVHYVDDNDDISNDNDNSKNSMDISSSSSSGGRRTMRQELKRRSTFAQLTVEIQQFQKVVAELESILQESGETPEAAWRARILLQTAQETDKDLWQKLYQYETTLSTLDDINNSNEEMRKAQSACMKLHRDFKRSHKSLVMALTLYEKQQHTEISRLGAVGWSVPNENTANGQVDEEEDYFDRALRKSELEKMNASMHQVNQILNDLAGLVEEQQDDIDSLEDNASDARVSGEAAADEINCMYEREQNCAQTSCVDYDDEEKETALFGMGCSASPIDLGNTMDYFCLVQPSETVEVTVDDNHNVEVERIVEPPQSRLDLCSFSKNMESMKEDVASMQKDLLLGIKSFLQQSKDLECGVQTH